jgi:hypothetical protein
MIKINKKFILNNKIKNIYKKCKNILNPRTLASLSTNWSKTPLYSKIYKQIY